MYLYNIQIVNFFIRIRKSIFMLGPKWQIDTEQKNHGPNRHIEPEEILIFSDRLKICVNASSRIDISAKEKEKVRTGISVLVAFVKTKSIKLV